MKGFRTWRVDVGTGQDSRPNQTHFARRRDAQNYAKTIAQKYPNADIEIKTLEPKYKDYQKLVEVDSDEYNFARIGGYRNRYEKV